MEKTTTSIQKQQQQLLYDISNRNCTENNHGAIHDTIIATIIATTISIHQIVQQFESHYWTPRQVALLRIHLCNKHDNNNSSNEEENEEHSCGDLAAIFVPAMTTAVTHFMKHHHHLHQQQEQEPRHDDSDGNISIIQDSFCQLHRMLIIYLRWVQIDTILAEEFGRYGAHSLLIQLLKFSTISTQQQDDIDETNHNEIIIQTNDNIETIQDIAGEIAAACRPHFPLSMTTPFTILELQQRLPLSITIHSYIHHCLEINTINDEHDNDKTNSITVLIHQICSRQSAQVDVGFVLWPSAVVLSSLMVNTTWLSDLVMKRSLSTVTVLELGAGCGLSGLVVALCLRRYASLSVSIILTDFNSLVLENLQQNIQLNDLSDICSVVGLDFYQQSGRANEHWIAMTTDTGTATMNTPTPSAQVDVVIAADIICQPSDAVAVANTLHDTLKPCGVAYIVCADAKHRFGVDHLYEECQRVGLTISTTSIVHCDDNTDANDSNDTIRLHDEEIQNLKLTTGYVHGMKLTLFTIEKP